MDYTNILTQLRRLIRTVNLESKRIEKEYGVSIPQLLCLKFLNQMPESKASQRLIGEFLSLNASTITGIISRLERKGLIYRLPKGVDKRVNFITLTQEGKELIDQSPELIHDRVTRKLERFTDPELVRIQTAFELLFELLDLQEDNSAPEAGD